MIVGANNIIINKMECVNMNDMDLSRSCRTCLQANGNMYGIFDYKNDSKDTLLNKLKACAPVKICKGDGLSSYICQTCLKLVESFFNFQQTCVEADIIFQKFKELKQLPVINGYHLENDDITRNETTNTVLENKDSYEECTDYEYLDLVADETNVSLSEQVNVKMEIDNENEVDDEEYIYEMIDDDSEIIIEEDCEEDYEEVSVGLTEEEDNEIYEDSNSRSNIIEIDKDCTIRYRGDSNNIIITDDYEQQELEQDLVEIAEDSEEIVYNNSNGGDHTNFKTEHIEVLPVDKKQVGIIPMATGDEIMGHDVYDILTYDSQASKGRFFMVTPERLPPGAKKRRYIYYQRVPPSNIMEEDEEGKALEDGPYECSECGERFLSESFLNKHTEKHLINGCTGNLCATCNITYTQECLTKKHKRVNGRCNFKCTVKDCTSKFPDSVSRTNHILTEHPNEKPNMGADNGTESYAKNKYPCSFCNKNFLCKSGLVMHRRTHTGEKPYMCANCGKTFATLGGLDLHQRRHTGERPFTCDYCNKGFAETSNLKVHIRSHTGEKPYKCSECGRAFSRVFLLQLHMRIHTGEKPYSCKHCGKAFRQQGDLASHVRIHNGDRPHKCKICDKGFIKSSGLTTHLKTHIRKDEYIQT